MPKILEEWINRLKKWWSGLNANQRSLAVIGGGALAVCLLGAGLLAGRPDYTVLFSNLDAKDASDMVEYLREQKVPYRLSAGGTQVEVPSRQVYDLRVQLAGKGLPRGNNAGFELFDKMNFGTTDQVQRINYLRALQSELERTIDSLDTVEKSRVHLVIPEEDLWFEDQYGPSASVLIKLRNGGTLASRQVESIRHLLASSVRGLSPERVTIVDTEGRALAAAGDFDGLGALSDRQIVFQKKLEEEMKRQTESMLGEILGPNKAVVRVSTEIDFSQNQTERESYSPVVGRQGLVRSEKQNMFQSDGTQAASGGTAGTASNLQGYPPAGANGAEKTTRKNERVINYEMNRTVEKISSATGAVRKLSVGVFLDGKFTPEQLSDITSVVSRGLGVDPARGDTIEIKAFPFNREALDEQKKLLEQSQREQFWIRVATRWAPLGLLLAAAVAFLVVGLKNIQKAALAGSEPGRNGNGDSFNGEKIDPEAIMALLKQNASGSARVLKHWLS